MTNSPTAFEIAVIGGGPAGSSAAYHLARIGRRVLLIDRNAFPREKACGDALTPRAVQLLRDMGLVEEVASFQKVYGIRACSSWMQGDRDDLPFAVDQELFPNYGIVAPRRELDHVLCRHAQRAGAVFVDRTKVTGAVRSDGRVHALKVSQDGVTQEVPVGYVVAADGASSQFARQLGLLDAGGESLGFAVRAYYDGTTGAEDLLSMYLPLVDRPGGEVVCGYGWVFPCSRTRVNVGVGLYPRRPQDPPVNLRRLFESFVHSLRRADSRLAAMNAVGGLRGAPLRTGGSVVHHTAARVVIIGDAAGLVEPFTGEGIGAALASGKAAAEMVDAALSSKSAYEGRIDEVGGYRVCDSEPPIRRRSGRSYTFLGKVVETSIGRERRLFSGLRRALLQEAFLGSVESDPRELLSSDLDVDFSADISSIRDEIAQAIGARLPFIGHRAAALTDPLYCHVRAAALLWCARLGTPPRRARTATAASIELAYLARLCHRDLRDGSGERPAVVATREILRATWSDAFALMAGDYVLVRSYQLAAIAGGYVSRRVSQAIAGVWAAMIAAEQPATETTERWYLDMVTESLATFYSLSCELGAALASAPEASIRAVSQFGRELGVAIGIANDVLELLEPANRVTCIRHQAALRGRTLPLIYACQQLAGDDRLAALETSRLEAHLVEALRRCVRVATAHVHSARHSLLPLPPSACVRGLQALGDRVLHRLATYDTALVD